MSIVLTPFRPEEPISRRKVNERLKNLCLIVNGAWSRLAEYTAAGAYEWEVPDLFGGSPYLVGVLIASAGGSGGTAAVCYPRLNLSAAASGGASGSAKTLLRTVMPGEKIKLVVGKGGPAVSVTARYLASDKDNQYLAGANGTAGGSSSFDGVSVNGGGAGKYQMNVNQWYSRAEGAASQGQPSSYIGGENDMNGGFGGELVSRLEAFGMDAIKGYGPENCYDPFEYCRMFCSGGGAKTFLAGSSSDEENNFATHYTGGRDTDHISNRGGDGRASNSTKGTVSGGNAVGIGNGGGAAAAVYRGSDGDSLTAVSGAGTDGAVMIYVQGGMI